MHWPGIIGDHEPRASQCLHQCFIGSAEHLRLAYVGGQSVSRAADNSYLPSGRFQQVPQSINVRILLRLPMSANVDDDGQVRAPTPESKCVTFVNLLFGNPRQLGPGGVSIADPQPARHVKPIDKRATSCRKLQPTIHANHSAGKSLLSRKPIAKVAANADNQFRRIRDAVRGARPVGNDVSQVGGKQI